MHMTGTAVQMVSSYRDEHIWKEWYGWISTPAFVNLEKQSQSQITAAIKFPPIKSSPEANHFQGLPSTFNRRKHALYIVIACAWLCVVAETLPAQMDAAPVNTDMASMSISRCQRAMITINLTLTLKPDSNPNPNHTYSATLKNPANPKQYSGSLYYVLILPSHEGWKAEST